MKEEEIQRVVMDYIALAHPKLWPVTFHVPSGFYAGSKTQAKRFLRLGFKAGIPDVLILSTRRWQDAPIRCYGGFALELKAGRNLPTSAQSEFLRALAGHGLYSTWTNDIDVALEAVAAYAALPAPADWSPVPKQAITLLDRYKVG